MDRSQIVYCIIYPRPRFCRSLFTFAPPSAARAIRLWCSSRGLCAGPNSGLEKLWRGGGGGLLGTTEVAPAGRKLRVATAPTRTPRSGVAKVRFGARKFIGTHRDECRKCRKKVYDRTAENNSSSNPRSIIPL